MISTYQTPLQKAAGFSGLSQKEQLRRARTLNNLAQLLNRAVSYIPPKMIEKATNG